MIADEEYPQREVQFVVPGEPATKSRARVVSRGGKVHAYTPEPTKRAEAKMRAAFLEQVKRLAPSSRHAFGVEAEFHMSSGIRRDVDNMLKVVLDGLNKVAWGDDWQVTEVRGSKRSVPKGDEKTSVRIYTAGVLQERVARCQHCDQTFPRPPSHAAKKYCSDVCRRAAIAARRKATCPQCGTGFTQHGDSKTQIHCSAECAYASKHVPATCVSCGSDFQKPRHLNRSGNSYCSPECKATYWRDHRKSEAKGTCGDCGGPTTKKTYKRCRDCSYAAGGRHAPDYKTDPDQEQP